MSVVGGILIFIIIWWLVLFTILPLGVQNAWEAGENLIPGQADGAPVQPRLMYKFCLTTAISGCLFGLIWASTYFEWVDWRQLMHDIAAMT